MTRFNAVYVQELTQPINAVSTEAAGKFAKQYAHSHGLRLLSVEREDVTPQNPPPRTIAPPAAA